MELSLPISAAAKTQSKRPAAVATGPTATHAQTVSLPLRFIIAGLLALAAGVGWLIAQPMTLATYHYNQHVIALTHLFVLGWITTIVMGAMYQLVPVALETKLYSERLAKWQFIVHVIGVAGMVWYFRQWDMENVGHFASAVVLGVALFAYNIARTLLRVPRWSVVATAVTSALTWISLAVAVGLLIVAAKSFYQSQDSISSAWVAASLGKVGSLVTRFDPISAMHAHAHLGAIGFFVMLIVGVSYKLIPMFTLGEVQSPARATASVVLLNAGLLGSFISILTRSSWKPVFAGIIAVALVIYGWELVAMIRARKRRALDWGVVSFLTAVALLAPLSILGVILAWPGLPLTAFTGQLENAYGFLGLIGVVSFAIIGMLYKIVPFLVWFGTYSRHIGKAKVPALAEMYCSRMQAIGYVLFLGALVAVTTGTLLSSMAIVRWGGFLLAGSVLTLLVNITMILTHYFRPRISPLVRNPVQPVSI